MKKIVIAILSGLFIGQISVAAENFRKCPLKLESRTLSSGEQISLPWCSDQSQSVVMLGYGNLAATNALLKNRHLFAVPFDGKALFYFTALNYTHSNLGPYKEVIAAVMVSPRENLNGGLSRFLELSNLNPQGPPKTHGELIVKIWVDSDLALRTGNEIWGYNKSMAKIELSKDDGFELRDESSELIVNTAWTSAPQFLIPDGGGLDFFSISNSGSWQHGRSQGRAFFDAYKKGESLKFGTSEWGNIFAGLDIQPKYKMYIPNFSGQLFQPN